MAKNVTYHHLFSFFGMREDPFHVSPDPRFYCRTRSHESALAELLFGIETRQGFMVLTGEAGTGKTTLLHKLLDWLKQRGRSSAYVFHAILEPVELLQFILRDFGVRCVSPQKGDLVAALHAWLVARNLAGDLPVLILDEAQALPQQTLDELRLLLNLETPRGKLLQIILAGQPELDDKLRLPALRQLRQRVMIHSRLSLLSEQETAAYAARRLASAGCANTALFTPEAMQTIYASSRGIPRVVNLLCEHALISAYAEQKRVISDDMVQNIAVDFDLLSAPLAVAERQLETHYGRLMSVPVFEDILQNVSASPAPAPLLADPIEPIPDPTPALSPSPVLPSPVPQQSPEPMPHAANSSPLPELPEIPKVPVIPKYWHRHKSRKIMAVLARRASALIRMDSPTFFRGVVQYSRAVMVSLIHDCSQVFRALTMPSPAQELRPEAVAAATATVAAAATEAPAAARKTSARRRNVLVPIANWLRQPISQSSLANQRRVPRSAVRK
ncbi:MAG TPA: AAA family ATPase [Candidatus Acidoferrum sp.]